MKTILLRKAVMIGTNLLIFHVTFLDVTKLRTSIFCHIFHYFVTTFLFSTKTMPYNHKNFATCKNGSNFAAHKTSEGIILTKY